MRSINADIFQLIYQGAGYYPLLDHIFIAITSYLSYGIVALVLIYFLFVLPFRAADAAQRLLRLKQGTEVALSLFVTGVSVWILKVLIAHPRPFVALANVQPLVTEAPFESFPSAHAALAMAAAIAVLPFRKHLGHLLIAFALVVALSRLYVGVHYPFDVGVGLLIGYLIPKLIHRVFAAPRSSVSS